MKRQFFCNMAPPSARAFDNNAKWTSWDCVFDCRRMSSTKPDAIAGEAVQNVQKRARGEQKHTEHTNRFDSMKAQVNPVLCIQMHCTSIPKLVRVLSKLLSDFGIYVYICIYIYIYIRLFSAHTAKKNNFTENCFCCWCIVLPEGVPCPQTQNHCESKGKNTQTEWLRGRKQIDIRYNYQRGIHTHMDRDCC